MDGLHRTVLGFKQMVLPHLEKVGVTPAQFWVMNNLSENGELGCGPLASRLGVTLPSVTSLVDPLEQTGLVRRVRSTEDRRIVRLEITPRGSALIASVWTEIEREVARRVRGLDPADVRGAGRVLAVLGRQNGPVPARESGS
jgi:DNA-binding MarR family transcriptional regulator